MVNSRRNTQSQIDISVLLRKSKKILSSDPQRSLEIILSYIEDRKLPPVERASLLSQGAEAKRMLGDYEGAVADYMAALEVYQKNRLDDRIATAMHSIGTCYIYMLEYKKSHLFLHKALEISQRQKNKIHAAKTCIALGVLLLNVDDFVSSLEYFFKAIEYSEDSKTTQYHGAIYNNISEIFFKTGQYSLSYDYGLRSLRMRDSKDTIGRAYSMNNVGNSLVELKRYEEGIQFLLKGYRLRKKIGNSMLMANSLLNIGVGYDRQGDHRKSLYYLRKSVESAYISKNDYSISSGLLYLAAGLFRQGEVVRSIELLKEALEYCNKFGVESNKLEIHTKLAEIYKYIDDHEKYAANLSKSIEIKEKIHSQARERSIIALELQYELKQAIGERDQYREGKEKSEKALASSQKQLLTATLNLTRKNEAIRSVEVLLKPLLNEKKQDVRRTAERLSNHLHQSFQLQDGWRTIEEQYGALYQTFITTLRRLNSSLTPAEIRMCILIRLNLSIKQIADTLYITSGTVKQHRNHIRKKLKLDEKDNLTSYLLSL